MRARPSPSPAPVATRTRQARPQPAQSDLVAAALAVTVLLLAAARIGQVDIYATADAGHYLADADALRGVGVRESRHLPAFPALIALLHTALPFQATISLAAMILVLALFAGFYLSIRGRFGGSIGEPVGALVYAGSTTVAEALGWYGGSMLFGLAIVPVALSSIDDALSRPARRRVVIAAVLCAAAALSHPLPFIMVGLGGAIVLGASILRAILSRQLRQSLRLLGVGSIVGAAALVAVLPVRNFYLDLQSPATLRVSPDQLELLWHWAYRENWPFWLGLIAIGLVGPLIRPDAGGSRRSSLLSWAFSSIAVIGLVSTVVLSGDQSYTTRSLYFLALPAGMGTAWTIAELEHRQWFRRGAGAIAAAVAVCLLVLVSFDERLTVSTRYYNSLTSEELAAIEHLGSTPTNTVLVTSKGSDRNAGTLFGWLVEGIARRRAVGPGRPYIFLLDAARADSLNAERLLAGNDVIEGNGVRIGIERATDIMTISVQRADDWIPLSSLWFPFRAGDVSGPRVIDSERGTIVAGPDDVFRILIRPDHDSVRLEINWDSSRVGFHLIPSRLLPTTTPDSSSSVLEFRQATDEGPITTSLENGGPLTELEVAPDDTWTLAGTTASGRQSVTLRMDGIQGADDGFRSYSDEELIDILGVSHILTWRESEEDARLVERPCLTLEFENRTVRVYELDPECGHDG